MNEPAESCGDKTGPLPEPPGVHRLGLSEAPPTSKPRLGVCGATLLTLGSLSFFFLNIHASCLFPKPPLTWTQANLLPFYLLLCFDPILHHKSRARGLQNTDLCRIKSRAFNVAHGALHSPAPAGGGALSVSSRSFGQLQDTGLLCFSEPPCTGPLHMLFSPSSPG